MPEDMTKKTSFGRPTARRLVLLLLPSLTVGPWHLEAVGTQEVDLVSGSLGLDAACEVPMLGIVVVVWGKYLIFEDFDSLGLSNGAEWALIGAMRDPWTPKVCRIMACWPLLGAFGCYSAYSWGPGTNWRY